MAQEWYKVDNVAKVFLATNTRRDPRVFRISCTLQEEVDPGFTEPWQVNFYPDTDDVGIVEVVLREA